MNEFLYLFLLSTLYLILVRILRHYLYPTKEYREFMKKLNETNKAFLKAAKEGNTEEMERINRERIALMQGPYVDMMKKQIPYMLAILALLLPFKYYVNSTFPQELTFHLPFTIPLLNLSAIQGPFAIFIFFAFLLGILVSLGERVVRGKRER